MWSSEALCALLLLATPGGSNGVRRARVPAELLQATRNPEPSGLAWSAFLQRYLVVSDDTGLKRLGTNHAPILLAMDTQGVFDAQPVPLLGVDSINDLEAITPASGGHWFLSTSHSKDRKARKKPARHALLLAMEQGRALTVLASLDLSPALARVGFPEVDLEGLSLWGDALVLGLKAPLGPNGAATLLILEHAEDVLRQGTVPVGALKVWTTVPLRVEQDGKPVMQGVSDLLRVGDGLVLLANAPKGGTKDGGGSMWWWKTPLQGKPTLVRRFAGLKPEGAALAPDGQSITLVFDCDQENPSWVSVGLPP